MKRLIKRNIPFERKELSFSEAQELFSAHDERFKLELLDEIRDLGETISVYTLGGFTDLWVPVVCLQCEDAACVKSCLVDALRRNPETGAIDLNDEKCVKCMACVAACPFGCALLDDTHNTVIKCDLCGGDPVCAHFCPTKAHV